MTVPIRQHTINTPYLIGEVHCYSTEIDGELALFDCGPPTAEAFDSLQAQLDLSRVKYLFLTHCHIDHYGLAARIAQTSGATILIPRADAVRIRHRSRCLDHLLDLLTDIGCDGSITRQIREKSEQEHQKVDFPLQFEVVEESDLPARLGIEVLTCPGHSQSDLVYLHGADAVSGDILLRNIFQVPILDVDLGTFSGRFRNYDAYCESLLSLQKMRGYRILPGHRWYVESLDATVLSYAGTLLRRADQVKGYPPTASVVEIARGLYGDIFKNPFFVHMKISEIVFALDFLANPGLLRANLAAIGLFETVATLYHSVVTRDVGEDRPLYSAA